MLNFLGDEVGNRAVPLNSFRQVFTRASQGGPDEVCLLKMLLDCCQVSDVGDIVASFRERVDRECAPSCHFEAFRQRGPRAPRDVYHEWRIWVAKTSGCLIEYWVIYLDCPQVTTIWFI